MSASRVVEQLKTENLRKSRNIWKRFEIGWRKRLVPMVPVSLPEINSGNSGQKFSNSRYQHCVKSVQIRSFFWSVFSRIRTEYGPEKTPYLDTFDAMQNLLFLSNYAWILNFLSAPLTAVLTNLNLHYPFSEIEILNWDLLTENLL